MNARAHDQVKQFQTNRDQEEGLQGQGQYASKAWSRQKLMIRPRAEEDADKDRS